MPGTMNQYPDFQQFSLMPDLTVAAQEATLSRLLVPGVISDHRLEQWCRRLDEQFCRFAATCPAPEWAPGLQITAEMRCQYELYLPIAAILADIDRLCRLACRYEPIPLTELHAVLSWPDLLARLQPLPVFVSPAHLLRRLACDAVYRRTILAALYIPQSYGGGFNRYPRQTAFLCSWLAGQKERLQRSVAVLDAACGCGEGTYAVAAEVVRLGFDVAASRVDGSTLEPLELAAAAHGWFPQDSSRATAFRERVNRLLARGARGMVRFSQEDLGRPWPQDRGYEVILCNGLLGGPLLHDQKRLANVIRLLAGRLRPGGILLAADRFHGGWKRMTPPATLQGLLTASGLQLVDVGEGVGAVRSG